MVASPRVDFNYKSLREVRDEGSAAASVNRFMTVGS
jgi:hypothetical protein